MKSQARLVLAIDDIPCAACADDLENIILETEGVVEVSVEYGNRRMEVLFDPEAVEERDILRKIMKAGIRVTKKEGSR